MLGSTFKCLRQATNEFATPPPPPASGPVLQMVESGECPKEEVDGLRKMYKVREERTLVISRVAFFLDFFFCALPECDVRNELNRHTTRMKIRGSVVS